MVLKILFTLMIIVGALLYVRHQGAFRNATRSPARQSTPPPPSPWYVRMIPVAVVVAIMAAGAFTYWVQWREEHRVFTVRVVNTRSGEVTRYAVYRGDVNGRSFRTVDGRVVTLADVERMELMEGPPKEKE